MAVSHVEIIPRSSENKIETAIYQGVSLIERIKDKNYSQDELIPKLNTFAKVLEAKLTKECETESKALPKKLTAAQAKIALNKELSSQEKLNILRFRKQLKSPKGYCFGLTMLVIRNCLSHKTQEQLTSIMLFFINCPEHLFLQYEKVLSDFYFELHFAQFPLDHTVGESKTLKQSNTKEILSILTKLPIEYYSSELYKKMSRKDFLLLLADIDEDKPLRLATVPAKQDLIKMFFTSSIRDFHAMAIFADAEKNLFLFDSNFRKVFFKRFSPEERDKIYNEILSRGFTVFGNKIPDEFHLNYDILQVKNQITKTKSVSRTSCGITFWSRTREENERSLPALPPAISSLAESPSRHNFESPKR